MKEILKKHEWLFFPILVITLIQALSCLIFISTLFDVSFCYIFEGTFKYSEIQTRAVIVAGFMQIPAIIFWSIIFILSIRKKSK